MQDASSSGNPSTTNNTQTKSAEDKEVEQTATKIQAAFRGKKAREELKKKTIAEGGQEKSNS
jgi:hypothetical protein